MLLFNRDFNQLRVAGDVDHVITQQVFSLDTKQHITIRNGNRDHHGRSLPRAESIFVDNDLETAMSITEIGCRVGRDKNRGFRFDGRQKAIALHISALATLPRDAIVAFALGCEV